MSEESKLASPSITAKGLKGFTILYVSTVYRSDIPSLVSVNNSNSPRPTEASMSAMNSAMERRLRKPPVATGGCGLSYLHDVCSPMPERGEARLRSSEELEAQEILYIRGGGSYCLVG